MIMWLYSLSRNNDFQTSRPMDGQPDPPIKRCKDASKIILKSIDRSCQEHKTASEKGSWQHQGISQHKEACQQPVYWENPEVLKTMGGKNKNKAGYTAMRRSQKAEKPKRG